MVAFLLAPLGLSLRGGVPTLHGATSRGSVSSPAMRLPAEEGLPRFSASLQRTLSTVALSALLLVSPIVPSAVGPLSLGGSVQARELASGSGSRVNKDPQSLLRLGLPNQPKAVRDVQVALEECQDNLARLNGQVASSALGKAQSAAKSGGAAILKAVPASQQAAGQTALTAINEAMDQMRASIGTNKQGDALAANERALAQMTVLEEIIASGYERCTTNVLNYHCPLRVNPV